MPEMVFSSWLKLNIYTCSDLLFTIIGAVNTS
jgi:hypothetical protein